MCYPPQPWVSQITQTSALRQAMYTEKSFNINRQISVIKQSVLAFTVCCKNRIRKTFHGQWFCFYSEQSVWRSPFAVNVNLIVFAITFVLHRQLSAMSYAVHKNKFVIAHSNLKGLSFFIYTVDAKLHKKI